MRFIHIVSAALALAAAVAFSAPVQARSAALIDPDPVAVPAALSGEQVARDIKRTLAGRGWSVTAEQPGQIDSTLNLRSHVARIRISYDAKQVRFAYVDSRELDYKIKKGQPYIHRNYLGWIGYLVADLSNNLQLSSQDAAR